MGGSGYPTGEHVRASGDLETVTQENSWHLFGPLSFIIISRKEIPISAYPTLLACFKDEAKII